MEFVIHWHWQFLYVIAACTVIFVPLRMFSQKPLYSLRAYRFFIVFSATYWLEHIMAVSSFAMRWEYEFIVSVPSIQLFLTASLLTGSLIIVFSVRYADKWPFAAAFTPIALLLSWYVNANVLFWRSPKEFVLPDGASSFWLFMGSLITTAFLFIYALGTRVKPDLGPG